MHSKICHCYLCVEYEASIHTLSRYQSINQCSFLVHPIQSDIIWHSCEDSCGADSYWSFSINRSSGIYGASSFLSKVKESFRNWDLRFQFHWYSIQWKWRISFLDNSDFWGFKFPGEHCYILCGAFASRTISIFIHLKVQFTWWCASVSSSVCTTLQWVWLHLIVQFHSKKCWNCSTCTPHHLVVSIIVTLGGKITRPNEFFPS